jgi:hypothetical protein
MITEHNPTLKQSIEARKKQDRRLDDKLIKYEPTLLKRLVMWYRKVKR